MAVLQQTYKVKAEETARKVVDAAYATYYLTRKKGYCGRGRRDRDRKSGVFTSRKLAALTPKQKLVNDLTRSRAT